MPAVTLYSRPGCHLCEQTRAILSPLCRELGLELREQSIESDAALTERYADAIPVAVLDGDELLAWPFTRATARVTLAARTGRISPSRE